MLLFTLIIFDLLDKLFNVVKRKEKQKKILLHTGVVVKISVIFSIRVFNVDVILAVNSHSYEPNC